MFRQLTHCFFALCFLLILERIGIAAMPQDSVLNNERATALKLLQSGQFGEAAKAWRTFLSEAKNQNDTEAWLYFGIALYRNNEVEMAQETLKKAVKLNPKSDLAHLTYASVLKATGKRVDAEKEIAQALKLNPNYDEAYYLRAVIKYNNQEWEKVLADADTVLKINPKQAAAYLIKAQAVLGLASKKADGSAKELPDTWKRAFEESAHNLEQYLQLNGAAPDAKIWRERITAMRFYAGDRALMNCALLNDPTVTRPEILYKEKSKYTEEARQDRINGTIKLKAIFDADGQVKHIVPVAYLGGGLTNEAIKAAQKIRFKPATKDGKPVCLSMILEFTFNRLD